MYTSIKKFSELTTNELYDILQLRNKCFIVDQQVAYQDLDDYDKESYHFIIYDGGSSSLAAYARVIKPNTRFEEPSLGRVCINEQYRDGTYFNEIYKEVIRWGDFLGYKVWRAILQKKYWSIWKRKGWEIDKEIIEDGVESYEVILRR